jgi:hypothetical protein
MFEQQDLEKDLTVIGFPLNVDNVNCLSYRNILKFLRQEVYT